MKKVEPISPETLEAMKTSLQEVKNIEKQISKRIDYILKFLFKTFDHKVAYWYYYEGADDDGDGTYHESVKGANIDLICVADAKDEDNDTEVEFILKNGKKFFWSDSIPTRWLHEDSFEEEVLNGKKLMDQKNSKKIKAQQVNQEYTAGLIKSAKKKLTQEEFDALWNK